MTVTIMIDGSVKRNRKFGFKLYSSHVIEKRYNTDEEQWIHVQLGIPDHREGDYDR